MDPKLLEVAHELDAAWIIGLYIAIHGGDPPPFAEESKAELAELLARGFAGQLPGVDALPPAQLIENLAKLNIKVSTKIGNSKTELKTANDVETFSKHFHSGPGPFVPHMICIVVPGFGEFCWTFRYRPTKTLQ